MSDLYVRALVKLGEEEAEEVDPEPLSVKLATDAIKASLVHTFGYVHGAVPFEMFAVLPKERHAVIKIDKRDKQKFLTSLPLFRKYKGETCFLQVLQIANKASQVIHHHQT